MTAFPATAPTGGPAPGRRRARIRLAGGVVLALLAGCTDFDVDMRDLANGPDTTAAALTPVQNRPEPDDRGVISYPGYQVAVARRGDTVADVAARVGLPAEELASFNGAPANAALNRGEVLALPRRVAEPSPATGAATTGPIRPVGSVDVTTLAGSAIDRAEASDQPATITRATPAAQPARSQPAAARSGDEPVRHRVAQGETAFSIARRYNVPLDALVEWNGLDAERTVRLGQYLLIPPASGAPAPRQVAAAPTPPGTGSRTPTPPSAAQPLPEDQPAPAAAPAAVAEAVPESPNLAEDRTEASAPTAEFAAPVSAPIIRDFARGRNERLDYGAAAGTPVRAAANGTVIYVNEEGSEARVILVRHENGLRTAYANVQDLDVAVGDRVRKGDVIAAVGEADPPVFGFAVLDGVDPVDPTPYLE